MKKIGKNLWKHRAYVIMSLPVVLILIFFAYIPMAGIILAFKKFDYTLGIWNSPWCGLDNFGFLISSKKIFLNMTKNLSLIHI